MDATGAVALPETPIYEAVIVDRGWSPEDLQASLDVDAMIAASYGSGASARPGGALPAPGIDRAPSEHGPA
jgi:hypothetical protein